MTFTWTQVAAWRMARHHLEHRAPRAQMLEVAADLCGLHAQLMSSAELTLWARVEGIERDDVSEALWEKRTLVKTWAMRGTLHLLASSDYPGWQAALGTYDHFRKGAWVKASGVGREELDRTIEAVGKVLNAKTLTRQELAAAVYQVTGSEHIREKLLESWGALLKPASYQGKLCFAPNRGRNVAFTSPRSWLKHSDAVDPKQAVQFVTRQFLAANGPATREDYGRWWAISPAQAQARIKELGDEVVEVDVEGVSMWMLADQVAELKGAAGKSVRLLPAFDQYVIASGRHIENLLPGPHKARIYRPQGWVSPVILVDGRMVGVWRHEVKKSVLTVSVEPFEVFTPATIRGLKRESESLARYLGAAGNEFVHP